MRYMATNLQLPDAVGRRLARRAANEGRTPAEIAAELLDANLPPDAVVEGESPAGAPVVKRMPYIRARPAAPADAKTMTAQEFCDWIKDLELQQFPAPDHAEERDGLLRHRTAQ
jgi:hypothetical protein